MSKVIWIVLIIVMLVVLVKWKTKKYFWKDRQGKELTFKEFTSRWKEGAEGVTPLQQAKITLWSFPALFGGIVWGIVITLMGGVYWMALILTASFPITSMQLLSTWQKYRRLKETDKLMRELDEDENKKRV